MTLLELKRKYIAEGFKMGYKRAINEAVNEGENTEYYIAFINLRVPSKNGNWRIQPFYLESTNKDELVNKLETVCNKTRKFLKMHSRFMRMGNNGVGGIFVSRHNLKWIKSNCIDERKVRSQSEVIADIYWHGDRENAFLEVDFEPFKPAEPNPTPTRGFAMGRLVRHDAEGKRIYNNLISDPEELKALKLFTASNIAKIFQSKPLNEGTGGYYKKGRLYDEEDSKYYIALIKLVKNNKQKQYFYAESDNFTKLYKKIYSISAKLDDVLSEELIRKSIDIGVVLASDITFKEIVRISRTEDDLHNYCNPCGKVLYAPWNETVGFRTKFVNEWNYNDNAKDIFEYDLQRWGDARNAKPFTLPNLSKFIKS